MNNEQLMKEILGYKKNSKALCDMMSLYLFWDLNKIFSKSLNNDNYISNSLINNILKDLEDKDINLPLKFNSIDSLINLDYRNFEKVKNLLMNSENPDLMILLEEDSRLTDLKNYFNKSANIKKNYNLIEDIYDYNCNYLTEFLYSNIDMKKKINILIEIINISLSYQKQFSLEYLKAIFNLKEGSKKAKIEELIKCFKNDMNVNYEKKQKLFENIVYYNRNNEPSIIWINFLQEVGLVDFSDLIISDNYSKSLQRRKK